MGLQFIFGGSGAGKSTLVYKKIIEQSMLSPEKNFLVMVPDQFTMYTQKEICTMHPRGGIMNIDVLSFSRLIHRVADEVGQKERVVLDDTGKNLILRRIASELEDELLLLKAKLKRPGYIHEVKSVISEFYQYDIGLEELDEMIKSSEGRGTLSYKLKDLRLLYDGFQKYIKEKYITTEEALEELCEMIPKSAILKNSVIVFDGFTGFTPIQNRVILELLKVADHVMITLCADSEQDICEINETDAKTGNGQQRLFALSQKTYQTFLRHADKLQVPVYNSLFLKDRPVFRYKQNKAMAFLEEELFRYRQKTYQGQQDAISVYEAETLVEEVQHVCLEIKRLVRENNYFYRDIAVVTGDLSRFAHLIETEFLRYEIPAFLDQNRSVASHSMMEYLKSALAVIKDNFSYESVMRYLRCPFNNLTDNEADRMENYICQHGIRGKKVYERMFVRGEKEELEDINNLRIKMMDELNPLLGKCRTAREFTMAVYKLCEVSGLQKKCNDFANIFTGRDDLATAKEYQKIYEACMELLNQLYELIGDDVMEIDEYIQIFEAGVSEIQIGTIPQNVDQVVVGDIERTRLKKIKALFFIGVNDGVIPAKGGSGGLISDVEREFLIESGRDLAPSPRQKIFQQRLYLYQNMTKPKEYLFLSYSRVDGSGKNALPSYLIRVLLGLFPGLSIQTEEDYDGSLAKIATKEDGLDDFASLIRIFSNQELAAGSREYDFMEQELNVLYHAYAGLEDAPVKKEIEKMTDAAFFEYRPKPLSKEASDLLYRDRNKGSVSRLELFASCAFAHFLKYGLELETKSQYEFNAIDFGSVYHGVLEHFLNQLRSDNKSLADISMKEAREMIEVAMDSYAKEYGETILYSSARNEHRISQMKNVLFNSVRTMQYHLKKGSFEPSYFEQKFTMEGQFPLIGKIDRIDLSKEDGQIFVKVVDYKSGSKKFNLDELFYGLSMQLPVYMNAAMTMMMDKYPRQTLVPAAMLYYRLQNPYVEDSELTEGSILKTDEFQADTMKSNPDQSDDLKSDVKSESEDIVTQTEERMIQQEINSCIYKKMKMDGLTIESDDIIRKLDQDFSMESDVITASKKKDGSFKSQSQTLPDDDFDLLLKYTDVKTQKLMQSIQEGEISIHPVCVEKAAYDSCSFCLYHEVCRLDLKIPGFGLEELPQMDSENRKEAMKDAVYTGSTESN